MDIYTDKIEVEISAVIGSCVLKLADFLKLHPGSVLKLNRGNDRSVRLNAGNITVARGRLNSRNERLEVEVGEKLQSAKCLKN